jgi:ribosomal protein S18 acetylase RimI-like enzyme
MTLGLRQFGWHDGVPTFRDSALLGMYARAAAEGSLRWLNVEGDLPDGPAFLRAVKTAFYFAEVLRAGQSCGMVWLNRHEQRRAHVHFCFWHCVRGPVGRAIGRQVMARLTTLRQADGSYALDVIWGVVPADNRRAVAFLVRCGATVTGPIEKYVWDAATGCSRDGVHFHFCRRCEP